MKTRMDPYWRAVALLRNWREAVGKDPGETMTLADHAEFKAWAERRTGAVRL